MSRIDRGACDPRFGPKGRRGIEIHEAPETVVASIVIVKEAELEPQIDEGAEPEVEG